MDSVKTLSAYLIALIFVALFQISQVTAVVEDEHDFWAVLIAGYATDKPDDPSYHEDIYNTYYMYHVLTTQFGYSDDNIHYLSVDVIDVVSGAVDEVATKQSVRNAITSWLKTRSGPCDTVLIYFCGHGEGYYTGNKPGPMLPPHYSVGNGIEYNGDEGEEVRETTINMDVNGDEIISTDTWAGIDENLLIWDTEAEVWEHYWDDEIAEDLDQVDYGALVFLVQACKGFNETSGSETCMSGGLIDDLSRPGRVIISASNETNYSYGDNLYDTPGQAGYEFSEFSEYFIDALHGERAYWAGYIAHTGEEVKADIDIDPQNGYVSVLEAFGHALIHDPYVEGVEGRQERPWLDDDGDGLPTYVHEQDEGDHIDDGEFARHVYLNAYADVKILDVWTSTTVADPFVDIFVWVENDDSDVPNPVEALVTVSVYADDVCVGTKEALLAADSDVTLEYTWDSTGFEKGDYTVSASISLASSDLYSGDNEFIDGGVHVGVDLSVETYLTNGTAIYGVKVWIDGVAYDSWVTTEVGYGDHSVKLESPLRRDGHKYYFKWEDGKRYNPRTFNIVSDTTLRAYYNAVPDAPQISGPTSGTPDTSYTYNISTTDPEGDDVRYWIDWGDPEDTVTEYSQSGTTVSVSHSWEYSGTYNILLYATDSVNPFCPPSDLSYLEVSITGVNLVVEVPQAEPDGVTVRVDDKNYTSPVDIIVEAGSHVIEVPESFINDAGTGTYYVFTFSHWSDGSTDNPRTEYLTEDTTLTAYYKKSERGIQSEEP